MLIPTEFRMLEHAPLLPMFQLRTRKNSCNALHNACANAGRLKASHDIFRLELTGPIRNFMVQFVLVLFSGAEILEPRVRYPIRVPGGNRE